MTTLSFQSRCNMSFRHYLFSMPIYLVQVYLISSWSLPNVLGFCGWGDLCPVLLCWTKCNFPAYCCDLVGLQWYCRLSTVQRHRSMYTFQIIISNSRGGCISILLFVLSKLVLQLSRAMSNIHIGRRICSNWLRLLHGLSMTLKQLTQTLKHEIWVI